MRSPRFSLVAVPLLVIVLGGCTSGGVTTEGEPALGPIPTITSEAGIPQLPLDAYRVSSRQQQNALEATRVVARKCMTRFGFDWHGNDPTPQPDLDALASRRYGLINKDDAVRYGYQAPPSSAGDQPVKNANFDPSPDELAVWRGTASAGARVNGVAVPDGGCQGEVNRKMEAGAPQGDVNLAQNLAGQSFNVSKTDSRLVAAAAQWSACMKQAGYSYKNPSEPNAIDWRTRPNTEQVATATADVACRHQTNLVGIWVAVDTAYQKRLVEKNAQQLSLVRQQLDAESRNAAAILAGTDG